MRSRRGGKTDRDGGKTQALKQEEEDNQSQVKLFWTIRGGGGKQKTGAEVKLNTQGKGIAIKTENDKTPFQINQIRQTFQKTTQYYVSLPI